MASAASTQHTAHGGLEGTPVFESGGIAAQERAVQRTKDILEAAKRPGSPQAKYVAAHEERLRREERILAKMKGRPAIGTRVYWHGTQRKVVAVREGRTRDGERAVLVQLQEDGRKQRQPWIEWWRVEKFAYAIHAPEEEEK